MKVQRRGRKIAMNPDEVDAFLAQERTCRVATSSPDGPHLTPLWFVWDGTALWLNSVAKSQAIPTSPCSSTEATRSTNCAAWRSVAGSPRWARYRAPAHRIPRSRNRSG